MSISYTVSAFQLFTPLSHSTPLYQILTHALSNPTNRTKFTLLFSNVTEADILLREEFDALKKKYPSKFDVVYALDKPPQGWNGATGFINADLLKQYVPPATLSEKIKVFVCGTSTPLCIDAVGF